VDVMSFSVWFRQWIGTFFKLLTVGTKKRKSDAQRKKEREHRLKAKYSCENYYRIKKKRRRRRSSHSAQNERLIGALFKFMATSLGILLLPFGLLDWGRKSAKVRKASKGSGVAKKPSHKSTAKTTVSPPKKTPAKTHTKKTTTSPSRTTVKAPVTHTTPKQTEGTNTTPIRLFEYSEPKVVPPVLETIIITEPDENTPKSTPKNEKDQYIRKRMIIAGSNYCDKAVLDTPEVGSHIDLEAEPDNPYDKNAVKLLIDGQKIGYIAKKDHMAFVTCLKLKRKIYGVITAIIEEDGQTKYEYETWFDMV
jgi:hypothetical protein